MNICFFNLAEAEGANVANGVVRVASVLAGALRKRGHSVVFYPPPIHSRCKRAELVALGLQTENYFVNF